MEEPIVKIKPLCVRKISNWSSFHNSHNLVDNLEESMPPEGLLATIKTHSPKLNELLHKIETLDEQDMKKHGKLFKHFIFSDLKSSKYGVKLLASALIAKGHKLGYSSKETYKSSKNGKNAKRIFSKIQLDSENELEKTEFNNFYLLTSGSIFKQTISVPMKKEILRRFNDRPSNNYGKYARIIIMDSGFKEGIDLFDIKYIHIFEPQVTLADQKQIIGRGTRTCGQKGLEFHPTMGWPLHVFIYDATIPTKIQPTMSNTDTLFHLYLKALNIDLRLYNLTEKVEIATIEGSVDYELNKNIHTFKTQKDDSDEMTGGAIKFNVVDEFTKRKDVPTHASIKKLIEDKYQQYMWDTVKMENLCEEKKTGGKGGANLITYTPTQDFLRHYFTPENPVKGMLLWNSVGTGKCHAKDTKILMHDGTIKLVQDVQVGDKLMGDDSTPRKVLSLAQGEDEMYDVIPVKGDKYNVNSEHILCLKYSGGSIIHNAKRQPNFPFKTTMIDNKTFKIKAKSFKTREEAETYLDTFKEEDKILEIEVNQYNKLSESLKRDLKGYRKGVEFNEKPINFDPYIMGIWLGDGSSRDPVITNQDAKILKYLQDVSKQYGLSLNYQSKYSYRLSKDGTTKTNAFIDELHKYNLIHNKHIPDDYKCNTRDIRLKTLAGLLDSDGYYCKKGKLFGITQKSDVLADDILFLARSLGYAAYSKKAEKSCKYNGEVKTGLYNVIHISGNNLDEIPTLLTRKRAEKRTQIKDVLSTGVRIVPTGMGDYYGFCIDGNRRYIMGDFTVTHNTCSAIATATSEFERSGYTILWVTRTTLKNDIWKNMFDQVCSEVLRMKIIENGLAIPSEQKARMKLLSPSWKIKPISYKQFSNLVIKKNQYYEKLVKINGAQDPLRKTLLIIDEAHKLYGGEDLSSIERPDMNALHKSLMYSYAASGNDSVKLLLMTATPITNSPMELIKLINLCKHPTAQLPTEYDEFEKKYLDKETGEFTQNGLNDYKDDIAGIVSYLNRENDARQFAQPIIHHIQVPMGKIEDIEKYSRRGMRELFNSEILELHKEIEKKNDSVDKELRDLDVNKFKGLQEICGSYDGKEKKECIKIAKKNARELVKEARTYTKKIKEDVKEIRSQLKSRKTSKRNQLKDITMSVKNDSNFDKFKQTPYHNIKTKCFKNIKSYGDKQEFIENDPDIIEINNDIAKIDDTIKNVNQNMTTIKTRLTQKKQELKDLLKTDLAYYEKSVVNMILNEHRKTSKKIMKNEKKEIKHLMKDLEKTRKDIIKKKTKTVKKIHKKLKKADKDHKKTQKNIEREEKKLLKVLRKTEEHKEEIKNEILQDLMKKQSEKTRDEFENRLNEIKSKIEEKEQKKVAKKMEIVQKREEKKAEKNIIKEQKQTQKLALKQEKILEKQQEKQRAKEAKDQIRATKKALAMAERENKKKRTTKKNKE